MKILVFGGAGGVGASIAFNLLRGRVPHEIVLVDVRREMMMSNVWDLEQVLAQGGVGSVRAGELDEALDADVVVSAAGAPPIPGNRSRFNSLARNVPIVAELVEALRAARSAWTGALIVVTNPVDPLCTWIHRRLGLDRRRILGYTVNDSLRLRTVIAQLLDTSPAGIEAWVLGEHGDGAVPLLDRVTVSGRPTRLNERQRAQAERFLRSWFARQNALRSGRTSPWTTGWGVARMIAAAACDDGGAWPASVPLEGEYGVTGVSLTVPVSLDRRGWRRIHEWRLTAAQRQAMLRAAAIVRAGADRVAATVDELSAG